MVCTDLNGSCVFLSSLEARAALPDFPLGHQKTEILTGNNVIESGERIETSGGVRAGRGAMWDGGQKRVSAFESFVPVRRSFYSQKPLAILTFSLCMARFFTIVF